MYRASSCLSSADLRLSFHPHEVSYMAYAVCGIFAEIWHTRWGLRQKECISSMQILVALLACMFSRQRSRAHL